MTAFSLRFSSKEHVQLRHPDQKPVVLAARVKSDPQSPGTEVPGFRMKYSIHPPGEKG